MGICSSAVEAEVVSSPHFFCPKGHNRRGKARLLFAFILLFCSYSFLSCLWCSFLVCLLCHPLLSYSIFFRYLLSDIDLSYSVFSFLFVFFFTIYLLLYFLSAGHINAIFGLNLRFHIYKHSSHAVTPVFIIFLSLMLMFIFLL